MKIWSKIKNFVSETITELKRVSWPGRRELLGLTVAVIVFSFIVAIYVFVVDKIFTFFISLILG